MKIKIAEATYHQLDYLVALTRGYTNLHWRFYGPGEGKERAMTSPTGRWIEFYNLDFTTNHALTGPLIESEGIWTRTTDEGEDDPSCKWRAELPYQAVEVGPTLLIAACRCIVTKHFGAEAEVPEDLV